MGDQDGASRRRYVDEPPPGADPTWDRLLDQLDWYDRKSGAAQGAYKRVKIGQLMLAAGVPIAVVSSASGILTASLGALVVLEGIQQLYQWQTNWVLYRSTNESLKHEKFLFLAGAGPYSGRQPGRVLAERVEGLVSQEHAKWTEGRHQSVTDHDDAPGHLGERRGPAPQ
jgi:hypothetical protein